MRGRQCWGWVLTALLVAGVNGCSKPADSGGDAVTVSVAVRLGSVTPQRFGDEVVVTGQWKSSGDVTVLAPFAAWVESLEPKVGDEVTPGQRIGWLVTRESRATLRGAELLEQSAKNDVERDEAHRALVLARRELVRVPLIAPRAGLVTKRSTEAGVELAEAAEVLTLTPRSALVCEAHVPAAAAKRVRTGQRASLLEEGSTATRTATVQRVLPTADAADQSTLVWLAPQGAGPTPKLDRFVTVTLELGAPHVAPAVPDSAVVEDDLTGATSVAVVGADSVATWTVVLLGGHAAGWRELRSPALPAGTPVIVVGQHGLPEGTHVKAVR